MRLGLTLPSFVDDPDDLLTVARAAESAGVDGVFVFDHLFRRARDGARRPSLEAMAMLGALAEATSRITIGSLVLRAWLRPPASAGAAVSTVTRIAPERAVIGIGAGDSESREENDTFGLGFGSVDDRIERLRQAVRATRDRGAPIWVGGHAPAVRAVAAEEADGWNAWAADVDRFKRWAGEACAAARREPFACSWGGLAVLDVTDDAARERAERLHAVPGTIVGGPETVAKTARELQDAGADWVILGAVDPKDTRTARLLGEEVRARVES